MTCSLHREEIFIFLRANDLSLGPTLWWLFTRAQMLGLKMSGYVSRGHPSWPLPDWIWEIPLTLTLWLLRPLPTATAKWSPHHHLWADSWLATNYHQDGALTSRGERSRRELNRSNRPRLGCNGRCRMRHDNVVCLQKEFATSTAAVTVYCLVCIPDYWNSIKWKLSKKNQTSSVFCLFEGSSGESGDNFNKSLSIHYVQIFVEIQKQMLLHSYVCMYACVY